MVDDKLADDIKHTYGGIVGCRTYQRFMPEEGRRETWDEAVTRYGEYLEPRVPETLKSLFKDAVEAVRSKKVMPSMRGLWTAGKANEKENCSFFNCFSGETRFISQEYGISSLKDSLGECNVLTKDGTFQPAVIKEFGVQDLHEILFHRGSRKEYRWVTLNHDWHLVDGTIKSTSELKQGDKIPFVTYSRDIDTNNIDYELGLRHGVIFGDGTLVKSNKKLSYSVQRDYGYQIRICTDIEDTLKVFDGYPTTYPKSFNGDPVVMMFDSFARTHALKELPNFSESDSYILGFFRGWLAADGSVHTSGQVTISTDGALAEEAEKLLYRIGVYVQRVQKLTGYTNFGKRKQETSNLFLTPMCLSEEDFIITRKRNRFRQVKRFDYSFHSFTGRVKTEETYCAVVPGHRNFVLENGLLTGNCSYVPIIDFKCYSEIMYLLMNGVGVGVSVERQYIHTVPEIAAEWKGGNTYVVGDSKEGWSEAYLSLLTDWANGLDSTWDLSKIRPKGSIINTFGGRASGGEVLGDLFTFSKNIFQQNKGQKLTSDLLADLACKTAEIVLCGGKN